jgi:hypothetical protein
MRITHISPEFNYINVNGTLSMLEKKSYLGSKLIKFDDTINIKSENIIYYQTSNNEQLNFNIEKTFAPLIYDTIADKFNNLSISMDESQTNDQYNNNSQWILKIDMKTILINYLFATLKKYRTFEGVQNITVSSNDVNAATKEYITNNLLSRYEFDKIEIFIAYNDLFKGGLRFNNTWDQKAENVSNLMNKFKKILDPTELTLEIIFNQEKPSTEYSFNYYYNLYFIKI